MNDLLKSLYSLNKKLTMINNNLIEAFNNLEIVLISC